MLCQCVPVTVKASQCFTALPSEMLKAISPGPVTAVTLSLARGWMLPFQGVVDAVNDSLRIGASQLGYSRLSFIPDPQRNKPSCYQSDAGKLPHESLSVNCTMGTSRT